MEQGSILRKIKSLAVSKFFRESRKPVGYDESYNEKTLIEMVSNNSILSTPGYRDGVVLVPVLPRFMRCPVVPLTPNLEFKTTYESRIPGETPRKRTVAVVDQLPIAGYVSAVLYRHDVLVEDGDASGDSEWEVVALLAHPESKPEPMNVGTLMANHFKAAGGTATNMTPEEFEKALRESYNFWKNHTMAEVRS